MFDLGAHVGDKGLLPTILLLYYSLSKYSWIQSTYEYRKNIEILKGLFNYKIKWFGKLNFWATSLELCKKGFFLKIYKWCHYAYFLVYKNTP